ncbi:MAG: type IV pilin protein [Proteobacteria bacterium]|nr:type IV pilin protein [Pseudomonadota bacterium]
MGLGGRTTALASTAESERASYPIDGGTQTYSLTIQAATASTFTLQATPTGAQADDKCGSFTLTNTGLKNVTGQDAGVVWQDCWSR